MYKFVLVAAVVMLGAINLGASPARADSCADKIAEAEKKLASAELQRNMKDKIANWMGKAKDFQEKGKKKGCIKQIDKALAQLK